MITKGIRGAITVEENTPAAIEKAVTILLEEIIKRNNIDAAMISHTIFTTTSDLNAEFPAKFARVNLGWKDTAMMCFHELDVPHSLSMCLRVLIVYNCNEDFIPEFVYLEGAASLRK